MWLRRGLYLIYLASVIFVSILYSEYALGILVVLGLVLPVFCLGYLFFLRKKVRIFLDRSGRPASEEGATIVRVQMENTSVVPTGIFCFRVVVKDVYLGTKRRHTYYTSLVAGECRTEELMVSLGHCGRVEVSLRGCKVCEPLGLFAVKARYRKDPVQCVIYPKRHPVAWLPGESAESVASSNSARPCRRPGDDPAELYDVREYREGDKLNRIHWSLSASKDQMYVKELGMPPVVSAVIFVELCRSGSSDVAACYNALLETVYSLSYAWLQQSRAHFFVWYDTRLKQPMRVTVEAEEDLYEAFEHLLSVENYELTADNGVLEGYFLKYAEERYHTLCYVAPDGNGEQCHKLLAGSGNALCNYFSICDSEKANVPVRESAIVEWPIKATKVATSLAGHVAEGGQV